LNEYPDLNTGGCYLKFLAKTFAKTKICKYAKTSAKRKFLRKQKFLRNKILQNLAKGEHLLIFAKNLRISRSEHMQRQ
jgi:hypothetical protein